MDTSGTSGHINERCGTLRTEVISTLPTIISFLTILLERVKIGGVGSPTVRDRWVNSHDILLKPRISSKIPRFRI